MKHEDAVRAADRTVEDIIGSRMKGAKPNFFADKNIVSKLVNTFQLEVANGWEHIQYDLPQQYQVLAAREDLNSGGKASALAAWTDGNLSPAAAEAVKENLSYWSQTKARAGTYEKLEGRGCARRRRWRSSSGWRRWNRRRAKAA